MLKKLFEKIKKDSETFHKERSVIINESRNILQSSKTAIFALHGHDYKTANASIADAESRIAKLNATYNKDNRLRFEGSFKASLEEFVEAKMFSLVMAGKDLVDLKISNIGPEEYISGLADLTGELVRQAVLQATEGNFKVLKKYKEICDEIVEFLLTLYLTGQARQKFDDCKRNLKRLEQIIYEVSIRN